MNSSIKWHSLQPTENIVNDVSYHARYKISLKLNYEADFLQQSLYLLQASADRGKQYLHELPLYLNFHFLVPKYRCC